MFTTGGNGMEGCKSLTTIIFDVVLKYFYGLTGHWTFPLLFRKPSNHYDVNIFLELSVNMDQMNPNVIGNNE